jgi:A/G-specific adenine glycosylase
LLSLPELDGHLSSDDAGELDIDAVAEAAGRFGKVEELETLLPLQHVFTHYKLHIHPYRIGLTTRGETPAGYLWWDMANIEAAALPAPVKKLLGQLGQPGLFG